MALYIPHSIFHLARLLYVRPETFGPYYVLTAPSTQLETCIENAHPRTVQVLQHTLKQYPRNLIQSAKNCDQFAIVEKYVLWHPLGKLLYALLSLLLWQDRNNQSQGKRILKYWIKSNTCSLSKLYLSVMYCTF